MFQNLYYRQTVNYFKVAIKSSKSVHKTRNIAIGSSQSCGSGNKVVIALLQDEKKNIQKLILGISLCYVIFWRPTVPSITS